MLFRQTVSLTEFVYPTSGIDHFLLACVKRMASGANFNIEGIFGKRGFCLESIATAADYGDLIKIENLIDAGADIDKRNPLGETALICTVQYCIFETVELLVRAGADADIRSNEGKTALRVALERNYSEMIEMLREAGALE